ncbi:MAG: 4Fe-4S binding protein [Chloroflexi bacterium]|nr:4Fe-4S binding protein [Chloroflexota bacterium]
MAGASADAAAPEKKGWEEVPVGAVISDAGNGEQYQTGDWRSERPVIEMSKCIHCFFCWVFCPDAAILAENEKVLGIDYYHCKGCGICSSECPVKCISMSDESAFAETNTAERDGETMREAAQTTVGGGV